VSSRTIVEKTRTNPSVPDTAKSEPVWLNAEHFIRTLPTALTGLILLISPKEVAPCTRSYFAIHVCQLSDVARIYLFSANGLGENAMDVTVSSLLIKKHKRMKTSRQ
jgi:hypothetical protein